MEPKSLLFVLANHCIDFYKKLKKKTVNLSRRPCFRLERHKMPSLKNGEKRNCLPCSNDCIFLKKTLQLHTFKRTKPHYITCEKNDLKNPFHQSAFKCAIGEAVLVSGKKIPWQNPVPRLCDQNPLWVSLMRVIQGFWSPTSRAISNPMRNYFFTRKQRPPGKDAQENERYRQKPSPKCLQGPFLLLPTCTGFDEVALNWIPRVNVADSKVSTRVLYKGPCVHLMGRLRVKPAKLQRGIGIRRRNRPPGQRSIS